jgi:alginate O-acetyltransferase complex protein AlgI
MSFISIFYLLFLFTTAGVYYVLPLRYRIGWLLAAGYFFYLTWQPAFLLVLLGISVWSYCVGGKIAAAADREEKKKWLVGGIVVSLLPLVFFKYFNFLNENFARLVAAAGFEYDLPNHPYLAPLGISFFTFLAISYLADIYRGYLKPEKSAAAYFLYLAFFPTLLAGPLERAKFFLTQIKRPVSFDYQNLRAGLQLILWGVFKKVVLADRMNDLMEKIYAEPQNSSGILVYFAVAFAVFQLFCDFSAYSDIAVGSARIFGIKLTKNFDDRVYAAPSREIFWRGWHRSLTMWLRDYVYFPLSRGVRSRLKLYLNLVIVYFLVGLWHGATWGFIVWGVVNGVWLVVENATKQWRENFFTRLGFDTDGRVFNFLAWLFVFHAAAILGVFFRADSLAQGFAVLESLGNSNVGLLSDPLTRSCVLSLVFLAFMDLINRRIPKDENFDAFISRQSGWLRWALYIVLAQMILRYFYVFEEAEFAYFNF